MPNPEAPAWLEGLTRAPVYRPTETEFADPIAFISRVEREASAFGICKVIPPLPKPSKRFVLANLSRCLSAPHCLFAGPGPGPEPGPAPAVFTTRQQELGTRRARTAPVHQQVWQSGETYTLEQFEAKSKAFSRTQLGGFREISPLLVESLFWKAAADKPIYIEYANDVPGSGFGVPEEPFRYHTKRRKRKRGLDHGRIQEPKRLRLPDFTPCKLQDDSKLEGTAGWKLSNSPWNLQVIARSPGSLTRFMPDDVPGVTSPMVYIGMLFSWFAWHVEDHELHSLNFLHMGAPKTWYAVPGDQASALEEIVRVHGYGGNVDQLASLALLGEKTTLLSPEVLVTSGVPCCRLVQNPGEFVITFPRAYHVGFSHGFNCGEAANFATPQWLKFAKDAAVRRAAMNYLPMLSHQQLLYLLAISFITRIPRKLVPSIRSSRLSDRKKEEREVLVKKAFLQDLMNENQLLCLLIAKKSTQNAVLWEPDLLPSTSTALHSHTSSLHLEAQQRHCDTMLIQSNLKDNKSSDGVTDSYVKVQNRTGNMTGIQYDSSSSVETDIDACDAGSISQVEKIDYDEENDLPFDLSIDSGSLTCVACGILGYPFMAVLQPSEKAMREFSIVHCEKSYQSLENLQCSGQQLCIATYHSEGQCTIKGSPSNLSEVPDLLKDKEVPDLLKDKHPSLQHHTGEENTYVVNVSQSDSLVDEGKKSKIVPVEHDANQLACQKVNNTSLPIKGKEGAAAKNDVFSLNHSSTIPFKEVDMLSDAGQHYCTDESTKWNTSNGLLRPRIFCLQHALEVEKLLHGKGGAHILVICHSDYLKIKALAISIAEEIGIQFDCKDVLLENASPSDLHLINTSIYDEAHEENGKDWTSSLGLNLKYNVKLRKQFSENTEPLALPLGGLFSVPSPVSVVSNLRWLCRKARTQNKVVGINQSRSYLDAVSKSGKSFMKTAYCSSSREIQVYQSRRRKRHAMASGSCGLQNNRKPKESGSSCQSAGPLRRDNQRYSSGSRSPYEMNNMNGRSLLNVPISIAKYPQAHQLSGVRLGGGGPSGKVIDSHKSLEHVTISTEAGGARAVIHSVDIRSTDSDTMHDCKLCDTVPNFDSSSICENSNDNFNLTCDLSIAENRNFEEGIMRSKVEHSPDWPIVTIVGEMLELDNGEPETLVCESTVEPVIISEDKQENSTPYIPDLEFSNAKKVALEEPPIASVSSCNPSDMQFDSMRCTIHDAGGASGRDSLMSNISTHLIAGEESNALDVAIDEIQPAGAAFMVDNSQVIHDLEMQRKDDLGCVMQPIFSASSSSKADIRSFDGSIYSADSDPISVETFNSVKLIATDQSEQVLNDLCPSDIITRSIENSTSAEVIYYVRRKNKRKRQAEQKIISSIICNAFARGPCEGLRPRAGRTSLKADTSTVSTRLKMKATERPGILSFRRNNKNKQGQPFKCDLEGCHMAFCTHGELSMHKRNRCPVEGCGKSFSSHNYAMRHQCVHDDERPLKCPWEGCSMSFKWAWARTEHVRLHTGERPYKCKVGGCGMMFRYVSDFSRHRRKTGHYFCA